MEVNLTIRNLRRRTYNVSGESIRAVFYALNSGDCWGRYRFPARFRPVGNPVTELRVTFNPEITMPNWRNYRAASAADKRSWDNMIAALTRHEAAHHAITVAEANRFRDTVPDISTPIDRRGATRMFNELISDIQRLQDRFDARTRHGQRDGVELVEN